MGEWIKGKRDGLFLVSRTDNSKQKKEFRSLMFKYRNGIAINTKGEQPNKAVIQKFDDNFKKYFPTLVNKKFKKKLSVIKKTIKEESKILNLKLKKMHRVQSKKQEVLKFRINRLENSYMRLRDTMRNIENHMFHLARSSRNSDASSREAIDNIMELRTDISKSEEQEYVKSTFKKSMQFSEIKGFNRPILDEDSQIDDSMTSEKTKLNRLRRLNRFMLSSLQIVNGQNEIDQDEIFEEVVSQMEESETLELGRFDGRSSIVAEDSLQTVIPTNGRFNPYPNHSHSLSKEHLDKNKIFASADDRENPISRRFRRMS